MKTEPHSPTRSTSARPNGHAGNDKNQLKPFEVILTLSQVSWGRVIVEAKSLEEADEKADALGDDDVGQWNTCEYAVYVHSVESMDSTKDPAAPDGRDSQPQALHPSQS